MPGDNPTSDRRWISPAIQSGLALVMALVALLWNVGQLGRIRGQDEIKMAALATRIDQVSSNLEAMRNAAIHAEIMAVQNRDDLREVRGRLDRLRDRVATGGN